MPQDPRPDLRLQGHDRLAQKIGCKPRLPVRVASWGRIGSGREANPTGVYAISLFIIMTYVQETWSSWEIGCPRNPRKNR